ALFRRELLLIKAELNKLYSDLRGFRRAFWRHDSDHPLLQPILALATAANWKQLLAAQAEQELQSEIERIVQANLELFDDFARDGGRNLLKPFTDAWRGCRPILQPPPDTLGAPELLAHYATWYYYDYFDDYDMIAHPILYATEVGDELDQIEVFRISPEDATSLVDEERQPLKLSGTMLGHFASNPFVSAILCGASSTPPSVLSPRCCPTRPMSRSAGSSSLRPILC